jgi:type I restriction enzyme M protein
MQLLLCALPQCRSKEHEMVANPILHCPIRGTLKIKAKAKDGLTFTEEKLRIDCIKHLVAAGYPSDRIKTETKILRVGHKGKNSLRADLVVFDRPLKEVAGLPDQEQRAHILLIAEIKRENRDSLSGKEDQLKPALAFLPSNKALGIYWDDVEQILFYKQVTGAKTLIREASITQLPAYGGKLKFRAIHYSDLKSVPDLVKIFSRFDDILHQAGNDLEERYTILLQILLLKIYDEHGRRSTDGRMIIQDFSIMELGDADVQKVFNDGLASACSVA